MVLSRLVLVYPRTCSEIVRRFGVEEWDLVRLVHEQTAIPPDASLLISGALQGCGVSPHYFDANR